jgi:hypothetical protein
MRIGSRPSPPGYEDRVRSRRVNAAREGSDANMICVTVEIREGALTRRVRITAPSIERVLELAAAGKPGRRVRLHLPIDPEAYFVPEDPGQRKAA